jgi:hypothetical protein
MAEDTGKTDAAHSNKIDMGNAAEVDYWTAALGVSKAQLLEAVSAAGPSAEAVKIYLNRAYPPTHVLPPLD